SSDTSANNAERVARKGAKIAIFDSLYRHSRGRKLHPAKSIGYSDIVCFGIAQPKEACFQLRKFSIQ
ncbi:MAG: hypothetical protein E7G42_19525, partial [Serratia marcescens]|nr:hypothetical protein [Serratia marcescens]